MKRLIAPAAIRRSQGRPNDRVESVMAERTVASKLAIRRSSRLALLVGRIGVATATLVASPHFLQVPPFPKKELPRPIATERTSNFASFAELAHAVKPAVIAVVARTTEVDLASRAQGSPEGPRSRFSTAQASGFFVTGHHHPATRNHFTEGMACIQILPYT